jgi:tetratricopeptide repeat protein 30
VACRPGYRAHLSYNQALCHYRLGNYAQALKHIADIIERGIRDHPELSVGMTTEGIEVRSVGNTKALHETALIEAFNLKAAIEYDLRNGGRPPFLSVPYFVAKASPSPSPFPPFPLL